LLDIGAALIDARVAAPMMSDRTTLQAEIVRCLVGGCRPRPPPTTPLPRRDFPENLDSPLSVVIANAGAGSVAALR
jgi:hypothetical protein